MMTITVRDVMTEGVFAIKPKDTVQDAALFMKDLNCGVLPVGDLQTPVGIITDRAIVVRVLAEGGDPTRTLVEDVMTRVLHTCGEDESLEQAAQKMRRHAVRRRLVTRGTTVTGIVHLPT